MAEQQNTFKYSFGDLIPMTNDLVEQYRSENDEIKQQFILADLILIIDELTRTFCNKFKKKYNAFEIDLDEAHALCMSESLNATLNAHDPEKGPFLALYYKVMENHLKDLFRHLTTKKEKFHQKLISGDACYSDVEGGATLFDNTNLVEDVSETICKKIVLDDLIDKFEEIDPYGKVIRCEMFGNTTDKTKAILEVLGAETFGDVERQRVQRTKRRFKKFLLENNFDIDSYLKS